MTDSNLKAKPVKNEKWENYGKKPVGWFVETQPDVTWADLSQEQRMASAHAHEQKWKKRYNTQLGSVQASHNFSRG